MNISEVAIKRPIPFIVLFILMTIAGLYAFSKIGIKNFPDMDFPMVTVSVSLSGATPEQLETQVTRKVEDSVTNIDSIKHINSTITDGNSTTTIEFDLGKNLQEATDDVKDAVNKIQSQFPPGTTTPVVSRVNIGDSSILAYEINANLDATDLSWLVDNEINKELLAVPGVGKITRQGGVDREIQVLIDPAKLISMNTTINNISNQLYNVRQDFSGGRANIGNQEQTIQGVENIHSAVDLANLNIPLGNGNNVRLGNIAQVSDSTAEIRQMAFMNGKPITSFQVYASKGFSELAVANLVRAKIAKFRESHPNITINEISNSVQQIKDNYDSSMNALYEGCILAIIVVWLFLRDWRATLISATALPLSIIPTFLFIYWLGFSLNTISLLSLSLVIGVLVDDAIVEVENIERHLKYSSSPIQASINAAAEIGNAVIATSFTLIAVFLPTAFMGGIPGRIFKQFGWTAVISIFISLLVARLLTPMFAAHFMKPRPSHNNESDKPSKIMVHYLNMVKWCVEHRRRTLLITGGFFASSLLLLIFIPNTFFPAEEGDQIQFSVQVPPGSKIETLSNVLLQATQQTKSIKSIASVYATIGNGVKSGEDISTDGSVTNGSLTFNLINKNSRPHHQTKSQLEKLIQGQLNAIPGAKFSGGNGNGERYSLAITGEDKEVLNDIAKKIETALRSLKGIGNISSDFDLSRPEIKIKPDFNKAAKLGVTAKNIGEVIRVATSGDYSNNLAKIDLNDRQIPIRVRVDEKATQTLRALGNLRVNGSNGTVPLASIAEITLGNGPINISRTDRSRIVTFNIDLQGRNLSELDNEIRKLPIMQHLPNGVSRINSGDIERMQEMFSGFILAMISGVICVYFVLVILFDDFKQPVTILSALPLAVGGALGSLVLFGYSLSMPSLIGILMLMGIVTKNSILLVDYIIISKRSGNDQTSAILDACQKRVRPIIMTTIAMIAGMIPVALGLEGDSSFRAPMAVTVIAGLITSTALSLLVIPVIFDVIDKLRFKRRNR